MSDIERVRALLKKRQEDEQVRGTAFAEVQLDAKLVDELTDLMAEKSDLERSSRLAASDQRMATPAVDTSEIDAKIEAKRAEVVATKIRFDFRLLDTDEYDALLEKHPEADRNQKGRNAFADALAENGVYEVRVGDGNPITDAAEMKESLAGVRKSSGAGEWSTVRAIVYQLNTRTISIPF